MMKPTTRLITFVMFVAFGSSRNISHCRAVGTAMSVRKLSASQMEGGKMTEKEKALYKRINVYQKETFREFLLDSIQNDDQVSFEKIVRAIGIAWGVIRTVIKDSPKVDREIEETAEKFSKKQTFSEFVGELWKNKDKILTGKYKEWSAKGHPHSFESKICFLLNPKYYKVIYDSHNRKALGNINYPATDWQLTVDKYFTDHGFNHLSEHDIFLNDCNLWLKCWPEEK